MRIAHRRGVTLIEILVVIGIIGLLLQLIIPAVQAARESARTTQCKNNLRQFGLAAMNHVSVNKHFPTGGWGWRWAGDPDRGFDKRQPGSWLFNILPYIEEEPLYNLGKGQSATEKRLAGKMQSSTPVKLFYCPTRRRPTAFPYVYRWKYYNIDQPEVVGRSDYAANAGDFVCCMGGGPKTLEEGDSAPLQPAKGSKETIPKGAYAWPRSDDLSTGVIYQRSAIRNADLSDGTTHTYLIGEKYLRPINYKNGKDLGDDQGWNSGYVKDNERWTQLGKKRDPRQDDDADGNTERFGSPHAQTMNFVFADGSVRPVAYTIDPKVHANFGNRADGKNVDLASAQ